MRRTVPVIACLMVCACSRSKFADLEREFVLTTLSFSPVAATGAGLHRYENKDLDKMLDDLSVGGLDRQRQFYRRFRDRLGSYDRGSLPPEDQADFDIMQDQIALGLLDLDTIQSAFHNP